MNKILSIILFLLIASHTIGQVIGTVDKKTKEYSVPAGLKMDYRVYGYQYANISTVKMICFSSHDADVKANYSNCPLGSYFDTDRMKPGDKIVYLGPVGSFAKMNFISGGGKRAVFYLQKSSFVIK
jgi:hypothetical protein